MEEGGDLMEQTLFRVKNLGNLFRNMEKTPLSPRQSQKCWLTKFKKYKERIKRLDKAFRKFERTYEKESIVFLQEFAEGWAMIKEGKAAVRSRIVDGHYITEARNETG